MLRTNPHTIGRTLRDPREQKTPDRFSLVADPALRPKRIPGLRRRKTTTSISTGPLNANMGMKKSHPLHRIAN